MGRHSALLEKIEKASGERTDLKPQAKSTRGSVAKDAGLSEHRKKTVLRFASVSSAGGDTVGVEFSEGAPARQEIAEPERLYALANDVESTFPNCIRAGLTVKHVAQFNHRSLSLQVRQCAADASAV